MTTARLAERDHQTGGAACPDVGLFQDVDWDLSTSPRRVGDIHPYPARFIPELPALALRVLRPNGPVLDPFCGSGTTLVEALRVGHRAIGVDINPIACVMSRVKTAPWRLGDDVLLEKHAQALVDHAGRGNADVFAELATDIPRVDHWFDAWAQEYLAGAVGYIRQIDPSDPWRDRLALAVSASTVRISRQDSDTRYAAVTKSLGPEAGLRIVEEALRRIGAWCMANRAAVQRNTAEVIEGDARKIQLEDGVAAAAIFSPPYPNAYEYWLYHKYRMYWLGFDPLRVRGSEIGARPFYSGSGKLTADDFKREMAEVFAELHRLLLPAGAALVVVGDSLIRGEPVDNSVALEEAADTAKFSLRASRFRSIRKTSTSFNRQHSRAREGEHVLLFSRRD